MAIPGPRSAISWNATITILAATPSSCSAHFGEMLHKWIIDVYLQTPHRGIKDTPAHRWQAEMIDLPPPLPASASELDIVLGMTVQRVVFHYGIELEGLKYNAPELGELRRRMGLGVKVELTFDPGDLGHISVLDPQRKTYIHVPAVDQGYARGLSLWQHKVIRRYAQRQLSARTDIAALAQAKAEIRELVERDLERKTTRGRKRHARFMEDHTAANASEPLQGVFRNPASQNETGEQKGQGQPTAKNASLKRNAITAQNGTFADDESVPVFEANLDLPRQPKVGMDERR